MSGKEFKTIIIIVIGAFAIALIINGLLSSDCGLIPSEFSRNEWFNFWTTYTTGVLAVIVGYLTIVHANNNSRQAIMQQNSIIIRQRSDVIQKEIAEEIKLHNSLFNIVRFTSTILCMNEENLPKAREVVLKNKSSIAERQIRWALIKNLYLSSNYVATIADEYDRVWNEAVEKLEGYTKLEMDMFKAIEDEKIAIETQKIIDKLLKELHEQLTSNNADEQKINDISDLEKQKLENAQKQYEARQSLKETVKNLQVSIAQLKASQDDVFNASVKFLSQINSFVFIGDKRPKDV